MQIHHKGTDNPIQEHFVAAAEPNDDDERESIRNRMRNNRSTWAQSDAIYYAPIPLLIPIPSPSESTYTHLKGYCCSSLFVYFSESM